MKTQTDTPPAGEFLFVLIQGTDGEYKIHAGLDAQKAVRNNERELLEGIILNKGMVVIDKGEQRIYTIPLDRFGLPQIRMIMDDYAKQIGYESRVLSHYAGSR